jgi:hypothetical protein
MKDNGLLLPDISVDLVDRARRSEDAFLRSRTREQLDSMVRRYRCFLALVAMHPDAIVSPTRDIDEMWHLHMLSPRAYHEDCTRIFGEILDHDGGFGALPEEEAALREAFALTAALWQRAFGEAYAAGDAEAIRCTRNCVSRCTRACKVRRAEAA